MFWLCVISLDYVMVMCDISGLCYGYVRYLWIMLWLRVISGLCYGYVTYDISGLCYGSVCVIPLDYVMVLCDTSGLCNGSV